MARSTLTGLNGAFFILVAVVLALVPVPSGSNRPFFGAMNAAVVGVLAFVYAGLAVNRPDRVRLQLREFFWPALLGSISFVWMIVQILPLPVEFAAPTVWTDARQALGLDLWPSISVDRAATALMILNYACYALLFFVVAQFATNESRAHRFMQAIFIIVTVHAGLGIFSLFQLGDSLIFLPKWAYKGVATGFFVNRNSFATFLACGIAVGSALMANAVMPRQRSGQSRPLREVFRLDKALISIAGYGAGIAVMGSALILTASRMSVPVGVIALLLPVALTLIRGRGRRALLVPLVIGIAILIVLVALYSGGGLLERFNSQEIERDVRWPLYMQTIDMISHRPIIGFGGGAFADAFQIFHRLPLNADLTWDRAHNLYLELFADLGVFALGVMAAVVFVLWRTISALRLTHSPAPAAAVSVAAVALVHSLVDFSLQIQAIELLFVAVLAAGYAQAVFALEGRRAPAAAAVPRPRAARGREAGPFAVPNAARDTDAVLQPFGPAGPAGGLTSAPRKA